MLDHQSESMSPSVLALHQHWNSTWIESSTTLFCCSAKRDNSMWPRVPTTAICLMLGFVVLLHIALVRMPSSRLQRGGSSKQLQDSPVLHLLEAAKSKADARAERLVQARRQPLQLQPQCQLDQRQLQGVLAAVGALHAMHITGGVLSDKEQARTAVLDLRQQLRKHWNKVLEPFSNGTGDAGRCKSVGLASHGTTCSAAGGERRARTALMLVLGNWNSLNRMLGLYAINLFTIWSYARLHGYGLELYVHGEPLPHNMPVYFIKVSGVQHLFHHLGYQHVLYLDFDTFTSPHSAPPLSLFYGEAPHASLLMQAEHNVCAAALLWRNTQDADMLLQAWWDVGASGCCPTFPHDQTALKHMLLVYLANTTQQHWLYGPDMQARFQLPPVLPSPTSAAVSHNTSRPAALSGVAPAAERATTAKESTTSGGGGEPEVLSTDHMPHKVSTWLRLRTLMAQRHSAVGWVGLNSHYPQLPGASYNRVVLHNCLGMWWGCVPFDTPALLYHSGHWAMEELQDTWLAERLLHSVVDWASTLDLQADSSTAGL